MESVLALMAGLGKQEIALVDADHRVRRMHLLAQSMHQALLFAITGVRGVSSHLGGGSVLNPKAALAAAHGASRWDQGVLEGLLQVEGAWPYIRANIDLLQETCAAANAQALVARRLATPLTRQLHAAETSGQYDSVDRVGLTAFNSDMAQLDARIVALSSACTNMMQDMTDALEIFTGLRAVANKARGALTVSVTRALDALLLSAGELADIVAEITNIVRNSGGAPLIHPEALNFPIEGNLLGAASNIARLRQSLSKPKEW